MEQYFILGLSDALPLTNKQ